MFISISSAYGRKYKNQTEARKDWDEGKDFVFQESTRMEDLRWSGKYCSKRDFPDDVKINFIIR
jgi:hypothetical protein